MKKLTVLFAAVIIATAANAAGWCSLRSVANQYDDNIYFEIAAQFDRSKLEQPSYELMFNVYFYDEWLNALVSDDGSYESANGQVAVSYSPYILTAGDTNPIINVCIPVDELHLKKGMSKIYYAVEIFAIVNGEYRSIATTEPRLLELDPAIVRAINEKSDEQQNQSRPAPQPEPQPAPAPEPEPNYVEPVVVEPVYAASEPEEAVVDTVVIIEEPKPKTKVKKQPAQEKAVAKTFRKTFRNSWDEDMWEEMRFFDNGSVEHVRVFKGVPAVVKKGSYIVYEVADSPDLRVRIGWNSGATETDWRLPAASNTLLNGKKEWRPVK